MGTNISSISNVSNKLSKRTFHISLLTYFSLDLFLILISQRIKMGNISNCLGALLDEETSKMVPMRYFSIKHRGLEKQKSNQIMDKGWPALQVITKP